MRKKVTGVADYIIPIGIVGVVGYALYKFLNLGGQSANTANTTSLTTANTQATTTTLQQQAAKGETATMSPATAQGLASQLYTMGTQSDPDLYGMEQILMQPNNLTDLTLIIQNFGIKQISESNYSTCALLNFNCTAIDLAGFVSVVYGYANRPDLVQSINSYYTSQGINYSF